MVMTDADLRTIRGEVGSQPDDDTVADLWTALEAGGQDTATLWAAVAAQILGVRYADQVSGSVSVSLPGGLSVAQSNGSTGALLTQLQRLRAIAGVEQGLTGGRIVPTRSSRSRLDGPVWPPRI